MSFHFGSILCRWLHEPTYIQGGILNAFTPRGYILRELGTSQKEAVLEKSCGVDLNAETNRTFKILNPSTAD